MNKFWTDMCLIPFVLSVTIGGMYLIDQGIRDQAKESKTQSQVINLTVTQDYEFLLLEDTTQPVHQEPLGANQSQAPPPVIAEVQNLTAWLWAM